MKNPQAGAVCLAAVMLFTSHFDARADVISEWNLKAESIAVKKRMLPPPNARAMAILHVAMFEAVNSVARRYTDFGLELNAEGKASKEAAAASAAYAVLVAHPSRRASRSRRCAGIRPG